MTSSLLDVCRFNPAAGGTTDWTYSSAVTGYQGPAAAGAVNGAVYSYRAESNDLAQWEVGYGAYNSSTGVFARTTVLFNSAGTTAKINFSTVPQVAIVALAEDLLLFNAAMSLTAAQKTQVQFNIGLPAALNFRNILYANGGMEVWQRGAGGSASFAVAASTTTYTADRWFLVTNATQASVVSQQAGLSTQSRFSARIQRNSGQTGTGVMRFEYPLTTAECCALRGQNISVQFYASSGANWSPASGTLGVNAYFGTGTEGKRGATSYAGETNPLSTSVNVTAGAAAVQTTFTGGSTVATNVTQGCLQFSWTPVGTAGAADYLSLDDVQLEIGSVASVFERTSFAESIRECQLHYNKTFPYGTAPSQNSGLQSLVASIIQGAAGGIICFPWSFQVSMRASPTITTYNPSAANAQARGASGSDCTSTAAVGVTERGVTITATINLSDSTSVNFYCNAQADAGL